MTASNSSNIAELIERPLGLGATQTSVNRLSLAAMTNTLSNLGGTVSAAECDWLASRAAANFGTVVTSGLASSLDGRNWSGQAGIYSDHFLPGLTRLADTRSTNTLMIAQLLHCGLRSNPDIIGRTPLGPSAGPNTEALSAEAVERTIQDYVEAARRAVRAGFDGVEIHAAHGYLPAQFLSKVENARSDTWGGSIEARSAFTLEIVRRVRRALPAGAIIQLRLSAEDMRQSRGIDLDETVEVANQAALLGVDAISLSVWNVLLPSQKYPETTPSAYVRERLDPSVPLIVAGNIWDAGIAKFAFSEGADQLAVGRMAIFNSGAPAGLLDTSWVPDRPPFTRTRLNNVGVPPAFVDYIQGKWPEYIEQ